MGPEKTWCAAEVTGLCRTVVLAGYLPRQFSPRQFLAGRTGLGANPPPQFGQTLPSTSATQVSQKVHSKEQIRASVEFGARTLLQCSQVGRSSSTLSLRDSMDAL